MWSGAGAAIYISCVACATGGIVLSTNDTLVFIEWRHWVDLHAEDVFLDVVG